MDMRRILILLSLMWLALPAQSEVAGQRDPEVQAAIGDWLSGNEADALPALAALAAQGNTAARLLLGQIDSFPGLQGDWLAELTRTERIAVLRRPGGLSGQRWTTGLDDPVAKTWARLWNTDATPQVVVDFAKLGEPRAAQFAALTLARRQRHGFAAAAQDTAYPPALLAYAIRELRAADPERAGAAERALHPADPQRAVIGLEPLRTGFADWASTAPQADPVVALCETLCPAQPTAACQRAALDALNGHWGLISLGSPVEALIPSLAFNRSPRGVAFALAAMTKPSGSACLTQARN